MKILSYITVALMLLQAAVARAETITSGNFQYEIVEFMGYDEEEAVVVGLAEGFVPSGQLAFPSTIKYNGKNVKVVGIGWSNHAGHEGDAPVIGGQTGITSVKIPRYMRFIGCLEFKDCPNIERYEVESGATVYTVNGDALVEISDNNGKAYHRLKRYPSAAKSPTYVVPATIDGIEFGAFAANAHLKRIYLVGGQRLGECWQFNNRSIEEIDCSNSTEYRTTDNGALLYGSIFTGLCPGRVYKRFTVPSTCQFLSLGAFCNSQVDEIVLPENLSRQGASANLFRGSTVKKVTYKGEKPSHVWECAFMDCANLRSIELGYVWEGELDIMTCAFKGCTSLATVTLEEGTKDINIDSRAFEDCRSLTAFPLTSKMKIKHLVYREFAGCESLTSFSFGAVSNWNFSKGYNFAGSGLKEVHWPTGEAVIPVGCFADCRQLRRVYLKNTTTDIYGDAFARTGIQGLNMMGVDWWSRSAFSECPDLIRLYFPDNGAIVWYNTVDFITESPQIVVNNPKIRGLENQQEWPDVASLYIAMVNGGTPIGNGWRTVYVPGGATELYSQLTQNEVKEMYTCEAIPSQGSVTLTPTTKDIKITSVTIEGEEAVRSGNTFSIGRPIPGNTLDFTVSYTAFGNPMTSVYTDFYAALDDIFADDTSANADEQWFTIDGIRIDPASAAPGIYIRRCGGKTEKRLIR